MGKRSFVVVVCAFALCCGLAASAAPPAKDPGKAIADDAAVAFKEQRFTEAAELFEKAYALGNDKFVRLRNAGRAWEEAGKLEYARTQFQKYLDKVTAGPDHEEVTQRLARLEARIAAQKTPPLPVAPPEPMKREAPQPVKLELPRPAEVAPPRAAVEEPMVKQPAESRGKWLGWSMVGGGAAMLAGGAAWLVMTESANSRMASQSAAGLYSDKKLADDRAVILRNRIGSGALLGAGAAGVVVGAILAAKAPADQVQIAPTPGGMALAWSRAF